MQMTYTYKDVKLKHKKDYTRNTDRPIQLYLRIWQSQRELRMRVMFYCSTHPGLVVDYYRYHNVMNDIIP